MRRSVSRSSARGPPPPRVEAYLFPAVVGGGLGDLEEVAAVGRHLEGAGIPLYLFRAPGRPLPRGVEEGFHPPRSVVRVTELAPRAPAAVTVSAGWGVAAAPGRAEPYGQPGPWSSENADVERAYGPDRVLHASLEEFARTLGARRQEFERLREGGRPLREIRSVLRTAAGPPNGPAAYRRFRAFDRGDVLHLFATFSRSRRFQGEFPEAVQTGPLSAGPGSAGAPRRRRPLRSGTWLWYASPSSSGRLVPGIGRGLDRAGRRLRVEVRTPWPLPLPTEPLGRWRSVPALGTADWAERFRSAELRIVTGSRTLLEALDVGGPFLYFNGLLGVGRRTRRHRPEKIDRLLAAWRTEGLAPSLRRDLADFARGRRVSEIVARAAADRAWARQFPVGWRPSGFRPPFDDAGRVVVEAARRLSDGRGAHEVVAELRREGRAAVERNRGRV